ncbi:AAA domain-containing protein [Anaerosporobacter mobilis DSM 15930]|jgi:ABC-type hemin transport system ATPase subunit|uniref:AAA domain-containing protein n=1 Tax=Anaerosporobacter mobilis DSM 15930 TaxID=1120996 RepID=A0A1M7N6V9_9FIRM|nr:AAA family ATPase [Anaerosporobacter mobilis]SHM99203.1 AAA domain-containing protein [Anaerosporobacter mobilis DSM 15930]
MNKFYLPDIKKITIIDYSLYKCPFVIDFSSKLNIVFGTNGTGKSTLLMIILFSIIGPYRGGIKTKTRKEQRKDNRPIYGEGFFSERSTKNVNEAKVISEFTINEDSYIVQHSLQDGKLLAVTVNEKKLEGKIISYRTYETKFTRTREMGDNSNSELREYLIYSYQNSIKDSTHLPGGVNTLISMLLDVMFFDEGRKYTFWNADLQETIIGKYIVDEEYYEEYCEKKLDTKAYESAYKKKSETLNYMKTFFENEKKESDKSLKELDERKIRIELNSIERDIENLDKDILISKADYKQKNNRQLFLMQEIEKVHETIKKLDETWYNNLFPNEYNIYYKRFSKKMMEDECPLCGKTHKFNMKLEDCILCEENLEVKKSIDLVSVDIQRKNQQNELNNKTKEMDILKKQLSEIKKIVTTQKNELGRKYARKNELEVELNVDKNSLEDSDTRRLDKARQEKEIALSVLNQSKADEEEMRSKIESSFVQNFKEFSLAFSKYSKSFFGERHSVKLSLPFKDKENSSEDLMIKFELDGKERNESYMLSESQRIFTDLAFRFSVLTTFHNKSFFMCETPDSTLDMFHETNAVKTFEEYIEMGNRLILTANARKSNLIAKLYEKYSSEDINVVDLTQVSSLALDIKINFNDYLGGFN